MPLRNYKTNKFIVVLAILMVFAFHGGLAALVGYAYGHKPALPESRSTALVMHYISLAGVDTAEEITNQHDDEERASDSLEDVEETPEPEEVVEEVKPEEIIEEVVKEEEIKPEEPKPVVKETQEVIATKEPTPEAPKILQQEKPKPVKKTPPKKQPQKQQVVKNKRQSKRVDVNRVLSATDIVVLSAPQPNYPRALQRQRVKGEATLVLSINVQGRVTSTYIEKSSGNERLDREAQKAAMKLVIKPYVIEGQAIPVKVRRTYQF